MFSSLSWVRNMFCSAVKRVDTATGAVLAGPCHPKYYRSRSFALLFVKSVFLNGRIVVK